jgi:hypothetical protein
LGNETNALLALKNAWNGAIAASDRLRELAPSIEGLPAETDVQSIDLEACHNAALAHALASQALRGLLEELKRPAASN